MVTVKEYPIHSKFRIKSEISEISTNYFEFQDENTDRYHLFEIYFESRAERTLGRCIRAKQFLFSLKYDGIN